MHRLVYCAMAVVWLLGCNTIEPERCATLDWGLQGLADGRAGHAPARLGRHADACARVGVVPVAAAWESGRQQGLGAYCQLPNALRQGEARRNYEGVCPDPRFEQLYAAARRLADARNRMDELGQQIDRVERSLRDSKLSTARRAERVGELRSLRRERDAALLDRSEAAMALDRTRARLGI
jgi:hypothetical protein